MKKSMLSAVLLWGMLGLTAGMVAAGFAAPAAALSPAKGWDPAGVKDLGVDSREMQWYLLDYGVKEGVPFAVARRYYTNESIKKETVTLLTSKLGLDAEAAGALYFTEYGYEYSADGTRFTLAYTVHGTQKGDYIHVTLYKDSEKTWHSIRDSFAAGKGADLVFPETKTAVRTPRK